MPARYEPCRAQQEPASDWQELRPCPFCGKPAELTQDEHGAPMVACQWCLARVCGHSDSLAAYKWNWRTEDALRARAEAAEATAARLNAANVRLMRRLAPALSAWRAAADQLAAMGQRAVAAEAALATARAEGAADDLAVGGAQ